MKPLPLMIALLAAAGCAQTPELDARETPEVLAARYPDLIPLQDTLGPPVDPRDSATKVEDELARKRAALEARARELQQKPVGG